MKIFRPGMPPVDTDAPTVVQPAPSRPPETQVLQYTRIVPETASPLINADPRVPHAINDKPEVSI